MSIPVLIEIDLYAVTHPEWSQPAVTLFSVVHGKSAGLGV